MWFGMYATFGYALTMADTIWVNQDECFKAKYFFYYSIGSSLQRLLVIPGSVLQHNIKLLRQVCSHLGIGA